MVQETLATQATRETQEIQATPETPEIPVAEGLAAGEGRTGGARLFQVWWGMELAAYQVIVFTDPFLPQQHQLDWREVLKEILSILLPPYSPKGASTPQDPVAQDKLVKTGKLELLVAQGKRVMRGHQEIQGRHPLPSGKTTQAALEELGAQRDKPERLETQGRLDRRGLEELAEVVVVEMHFHRPITLAALVALLGMAQELEVQGGLALATEVAELVPWAMVRQVSQVILHFATFLLHLVGQEEQLFHFPNRLVQ